jgi:EAL domain-containing protein (putative c-di-GMP-specific phosphodiesterase class I)
VRFGGDEFVVVCEEVDDEHAAVELTERLVGSLEDPVVVEQDQRVVTLSVGIAVSRPGDTASSLVRDADSAMNRAKERGRARIELFNDELRNEAVRRLDLDTALRRAIERGELRLAYQPIVTVDRGTPVGVEALLRWTNPEHGAISPAEFIPLAERSGTILSLGTWVLHQAVTDLARWRHDAEVPRDFWMSINLSARQLVDPGIVRSIADALSDAGLDPQALHVELTESALIDDLTTTLARLDELQALGVRIDVDDFGTGYSSLSYLKRLPLDTLKIDRSFIDGLGPDPSDISIVHAIVDLGHALGLQTVAEGVETETQLAALRQLGCDLAQGFHWSEPVDAAAVLAWVAHRRR